MAMLGVQSGLATRLTPAKPLGAASRAEPRSYRSTRPQALASSFFPRDVTPWLHKNLFVEGWSYDHSPDGSVPVVSILGWSPVFILIGGSDLNVSMQENHSCIK